MKPRKLLLPVIAAVVSVLGSPLVTMAQCAMCKASMENSAEAASASWQLNAAVLVLLIPPVAMFIALFVVVYRYRNRHEERVRPAPRFGAIPGGWDSM